MWFLVFLFCPILFYSILFYWFFLFWYPKPDTTVSLHNVPLMMPLSVVSLPANDCDLLRNWASAYGAAVRQRTVRQETTMAKHGTLPEYLYQRHLEVGDKVNLNFGVDEDEGPHEDLNER